MIHRFLRLTNLLILFHTVQICVGQESSSVLHFDHLTINDGLSHNSAYCILQDYNGYVWIGTQNGLNKYDGYSIEVFQNSNILGSKSGFTGRHITALYEDSKGNLWVGTQNSGINFKSRSLDQFINLRKDLAFRSIDGFTISSFYEDEIGNIWITTIGAGILCYHPETGLSKIYNENNSNLSNNLCFDVVVDKYDVVWVASAGGGLNYLDSSGQFSLSHQMQADRPNMAGYRKKLFLDDDNLWLSTEGTGLYRMNIKDRSYTHLSPDSDEKYLNSDVVRDVLKSDDSRIFIASDGKGLSIYDPETEEIVSHSYEYDENNTLNSNALLCMMKDRTGNIWIGTFNGGVNIYKPSKTWFELYKPSSQGSNDLKHRSILGIAQTKNAKLLLGTDGGGLNWLSSNSEQILSPLLMNEPENDLSIAGNVVKTIFQDNQDRLWIGLFGEGLDLFDPLSQTFRHVIDEQINVWSIDQKSDGELLIATMGSGIIGLDPNTKKRRVFDSQIVSPNIMKVYIDQEARTWVGTAYDGLLVYSDDDKLEKIYKFNATDPNSLSSDEVRSIFQDSKGSVWIGTEDAGLNLMRENGNLERIGVDDGLISNSVMAIIEDLEGFIWVSTFGGINRLSKNGKVISSFDFRTLENTNQFNQDAIFRDDEGNLYFGGINGLTAIHPRSIKENEFASEILLTDLKIYNKSIRVGEMSEGRTILKEPIESCKTIYLSYLDKSFSIDFTLTDYRSPAENVFSYRMHGFDDQWQVTPKGKRSVTYTNLDPGSYIFQVQHKEASTSVEIDIKAAYWQTVWFRVLTVFIIFVLLLFGMYLVIKRREAASKRKILQLRNEKLSTEIEAKNSKLMFSSVQMAHKNEILNEVKTDLLAAQKSPEKSLRSLVRKLDIEIQNEDYWKEFNLYFNEFDQNFIKRLRASYPDLTKNDLRLCSLLRMDLSTKEIASLLNVSLRAVEQSRYRLKKRIGLPKGENLVKFIVSFDALD